MIDNEDKKLNLSIIKAFELLNAFTADKTVWGVRELALKTGYNKSTVYRILHTLNSLNIVHQDSNDKYSLGSKLFELGNRVSIFRAITKLTQDALKEVALDIQETVLLSILKENQVFHIDKADSLHGLKINTSIGSFQPIHATASGKLLLAFLSTVQQNNIIQNIHLRTFSKQTISNTGDLFKELTTIKQQGFALDMEELESGLVCIAIPIKNKNKKVIAALSASGPLSRFRMENVSNYIEILQRGAGIIENNLSDFDSL